MESRPSFLNKARRLLVVPLASIGLLAAHDSAEAGDASIAAVEALPHRQMDGTRSLPIQGALEHDFVFVNVTVATAETPGFGTIYGGDSDGTSTLSTVNPVPGVIKPNVGGGRVDGTGAIFFKNSEHGLINLVADHLLTLKGEHFSATEARLFDSRLPQHGGRPLEAGQTITLDVPGNAGDAAYLNITPVGAQQPGFITVYPCDAERPTASNANYVPGTFTPNSTIVRVAAKTATNGEVCVYSSGKTDLVIDASGAISESAYIPTNSGQPDRVVDTRIGLGGDRIMPGESVIFNVGANKAGTVAILNVTVDQAGGPGFGVVHSGNMPPSEISNVNFGSSAVPNLAFVQVAPDGSIGYTTSRHSPSDAIVDVLGFIAPEAVRTANPHRIVDTRVDGRPLEPSAKVHTAGLQEIPYSPNETLTPESRKDIVKIFDNFSYGPHTSQTLDVYIPADPSKRGGDNTLITVTGGGWEGGNNELLTAHDDLAKHLLASGEYGMLISVDYRKTDIAPFPAQIQDLTASIQTVKAFAEELGIPDISKIDLIGFSAGADIILKGGLGFDEPHFQSPTLHPRAQKFSARPRKIIALAPPVSIIDWAKNPLPQALPYAGLNKYAGVSPTASPAFDRYASMLSTAPYAGVTASGKPTNDPPVYIVLSADDDVINAATQQPAIRQLGTLVFVAYNHGGPNRHVAGLDANIGALRNFIQN